MRPGNVECALNPANGKVDIEEWLLKNPTNMELYKIITLNETTASQLI